MSATNYIWDFRHDCYLMETDENDVTTAVYTNEPVQYGDLISQRRGSTTSYYHFDAIGSTERLTDASQATTDTYVYSAFGEDKGTTGTTVNPFRYVGELGYYFDGDELGYWIRARRYDVMIARWLSVDPLGLMISDTLYTYVNNRPVNSFDPSGQLFWDLITCWSALAVAEGVFAGTMIACITCVIPGEGAFVIDAVECGVCAAGLPGTILAIDAALDNCACLPDAEDKLLRMKEEAEGWKKWADELF